MTWLQNVSRWFGYDGMSLLGCKKDYWVLDFYLDVTYSLELWVCWKIIFSCCLIVERSRFFMSCGEFRPREIKRSHINCGCRRAYQDANSRLSRWVISCEVIYGCVVLTILWGEFLFYHQVLCVEIWIWNGQGSRPNRHENEGELSRWFEVFYGLCYLSLWRIFVELTAGLWQ